MIVIMIDGSEKRNCEGGVRMFVKRVVICMLIHSAVINPATGPELQSISYKKHQDSQK